MSAALKAVGVIAVSRKLFSIATNLPITLRSSNSFSPFHTPVVPLARDDMATTTDSLGVQTHNFSLFCQPVAQTVPASLGSINRRSAPEEHITDLISNRTRKEEPYESACVTSDELLYRAPQLMDYPYELHLPSEDLYRRESKQEGSKGVRRPTDRAGVFGSTYRAVISASGPGDYVHVTEAPDLVTSAPGAPSASTHAPDPKAIALSHLHRVLQQCRCAGDIEYALMVLSSVAAKNIPLSEETVSLFVKACCKVGVPERVLDVFEHPGSYRMRPTRKAAHYAMVRLSLDHNLDGVELLWDCMERYSIPPTPQTYHVIVRACCDNNELDRALYHYQRSCEQQVKLERGTYNILMKACYEEGTADRLRLMFSLYSQMREKGIEPNEGTMMLLAQGYVRAGDVENTVASIQALCRVGDLNKLQENGMAIRNFLSVVNGARSLAIQKGSVSDVAALEVAASCVLNVPQ